jgi:hypothetical protein
MGVLYGANYGFRLGRAGKGQGAAVGRLAFRCVCPELPVPSATYSVHASPQDFAEIIWKLARLIGYRLCGLNGLIVFQ